jgi:hypothetical protein
MLLMAGQNTCFATTVILQWDAVADTNVAGYKVYYKADSSVQPFTGIGATQGDSPLDVPATVVDAQNHVTATISGLDSGHAYYFAVTSYYASGLESSYSDLFYVPELTSPTVTITSPANNTTVSGTVSVAATATDNVGVTKVEFYVNGALQATGTATPYLFSWNTSSLAAGTYTLTAMAYDEAGNVGQSSNVSVSIVKDTTSPTVALTSPSSGATLSGTVRIAASASDTFGVSMVEFYGNGTLLAATNAYPYSYNWNTANVSDGSYILLAKAFDASGNIAQTGSVMVTVANVPSTPPVGAYTISDALLALRIAVGIVIPTAELRLRTDVSPVVNGKYFPDGIIDISDALAILSDVVGIRKISL